MWSQKFIVACSLLSLCSANTPTLDVGNFRLLSRNEPQTGSRKYNVQDVAPFVENAAIGKNYQSIKYASGDILRVVPATPSNTVPARTVPAVPQPTSLHNLEKEKLDVHAEVGREIQQLRQAQQLVTRAQQIADQARNQAQTLGVKVNEARIAVDHTLRTAQQAQADVAARSSMVKSAMARLQQLAAQLERAQSDLRNTKKAATNNGEYSLKP